MWKRKQQELLSANTPVSHHYARAMQQHQVHPVMTQPGLATSARAAPYNAGVASPTQRMRTSDGYMPAPAQPNRDVRPCVANAPAAATYDADHTSPKQHVDVGSLRERRDLRNFEYVPSQMVYDRDDLDGNQRSPRPRAFSVNRSPALAPVARAHDAIDQRYEQQQLLDAESFGYQLSVARRLSWHSTAMAAAAPARDVMDQRYEHPPQPLAAEAYGYQHADDRLQWCFYQSPTCPCGKPQQQQVPAAMTMQPQVYHGVTTAQASEGYDQSATVEYDDDWQSLPPNNN